MSNVEQRLTAILSARDDGYSRAMQKASSAAAELKGSVEGADKSNKAFKETTLGMAVGIGVTKLLAKAFDMVKDSIGSAMARADTMDNFRRTITLMTGSVHTADGALATLTGQVVGTAYGLNVAAKAAQGLVTSGINIKDSTRYIGGWLDAVSTYGDGTNATLSNVTFQLSQMAAKGKANLGDLKSAMEAGIPVIQLYAEATGQSTEAVSDAISKGEISAEKFLSVMDTAFRKGTASFNSIEGAAKKAGGTWRGTFDNMQAATTRGVLSIITSIENARKEADMPGLKEGITSFGKVSEKVLNNVAKVAGFTAKHFETLSTAGTAAVASFIALKVVDDVNRKIALFNKETEQMSYLFTRHDSSIKKFVSNSNLAGTALESFYKKQRTGTDIANMYYNALSDKNGKMAIHAAAKKLNIALTETDNNGITRFVKLSDASKTAILAESGALSAKNILLALKSKQIGIATAAQMLFNKAIAANPIGAAVVGITAAVTALKLLGNYLNNIPSAYKEAAEEAKKLSDKHKDVIKSSESLRNSFDKSTLASQSQSDEARRLVARLKDLESQSGDTRNKQWLMAKVVEELTTKYPELNVQLDKTGTAIKGSVDAIESQIDAMEKAAKVAAYKEMLTDLYKQQMENNLAMAENAQEQQKLIDSGLAYRESTTGLTGDISYQTEGFRLLTESHSALYDEQEALNGQITQVTDALNISTQAQYESMLAAEEQSKSAEAQAEALAMLNEAYGVTSDQITQYAERTGEDLEKAGASAIELSNKYGLSTDLIIAYCEAQEITLAQFASSHEAELKRAESAISKYVDIATTGLETLEQKSAISIDAYIENLRKNAEATQSWSDNVNTLMQLGVSQGMIKELEKLGPAGAAQAAAWVAELQELNGGTITNFDSMNDAARAKLEELKTAMDGGMKAAGDAARTSMKAQGYAEMGNWALEEVNKAIIAKTPTIQQSGTNATQALARGIDSGSKAVNFKIASTQIDKDMNLINTGVGRSGRELLGSVNKDFGEINTAVAEKSGQARDAAVKAYTAMNAQMTAEGRKTVLSSQGTAQGMKGAFDKLPGDLNSVGYQAGMGLYYGLNSASGSIYGLANSIASNVAATMRRALQVRSPSRVMMKIGEHTGEGFKLGLESTIEQVRGVTRMLADAASPDINSALQAGSAHRVSDDRRSPQSATLNVGLNGRAFRAHIEDIFDENASMTDLELAYS